MSKISIEISGVKATVESDSETLDEVLTDLRQALLGVGFCFKGELHIIDDGD